MKLINTKIGFALCGSFCTFSQAVPQLEALVQMGASVTPIMSRTACSTDTRFGKAEDFISRIETACGRKVICTIADAEPIGPKKLLDILVIAPCTGTTLAKLALGISDTPVTLAAKAHMRNGGPVVIAAATNDALGASAKNIGQLMNAKNIYFVPMREDDPMGKPRSLVADFSKIPETVSAALDNIQLQPVLF